MTLKLMQGFESMRDDTDFRAQGWIQAPTKMQAGFPPSISSVAGTSMKLIGAGSASTATTGAAGAPDLGYYNTGITVNQAWLAGGFALGFNASFNSGIVTSYGAGTFANNCQACFDGTRYWAIQLSGAVYSIATSTDLSNWTPVSSVPAAIDGYAALSYMGGGVVALARSTSATNSYTVYYTSNQGVSWSSQVLGVVSSSVTFGIGIATGNATYPHAMFMFSTVGYNLYVGTLGGTMTSVVSGSGSSSSPYAVFRPRSNGGLLNFAFSTSSGSCAIFSATASNASLNTAGAWSTATTTTGAGVMDISYSPTANLWALACTSGIYTFANVGSAGTAVAPTGAVTVTQVYSTVGITNLWVTNSKFVATGVSGHIVTSTDGITWVESGGHIIPVGVSGTDWRCSIYDGAKYVLFADGTSGVIATTTDGVIGYQAKYIADGAENRNGTNACGAVGVYSGTPPASATGLWTANIYGLVIVPGAASAGARPLTMYYRVDGNEPAGDLKTGSVPTTPLQHYYELVGVATSTPNTFLISLYVDGALLLSDTVGRLMGSAVTDITSLMILVPSRTGSFVAYDDLYFTLTDGVAPSGVLGPVSMVAEVPATDVQAQWAKVGTAASNSLSVAGPALSSNPANYITSSNAGDKDIYRTSGSTPSGYVVKAVQVEATFSKTTTGSPVVNLGLLSSGTESDSTNLTVASVTGTYLSQIYAKDPNGSITWTNTAADASEPVINHIS